MRLVLEYCDLGSLREALDQGAFLGNGVLNYHAILDTALDVAKAMCHLHAMNVLHSDLKVWTGGGGYVRFLAYFLTLC